MTTEEATKINHLSAALKNCSADLRVSARTKVRQAPTAIDIAAFIDRVCSELVSMSKEPVNG